MEYLRDGTYTPQKSPLDEQLVKEEIEYLKLNETGTNAVPQPSSDATNVYTLLDFQEKLIEHEENLLNGQIQASDQEKALVAKFAVDQRDIVTLNVGGTIYRTTWATLQTIPQSLLFTKFAPENEQTLSKDRDGNYFLDFHSERFRYILQYLRYQRENRLFPTQISPEVLKEFQKFSLFPLSYTWIDILGSFTKTNDTTIRCNSGPFAARANIHTGRITMHKGFCFVLSFLTSQGKYGDPICGQSDSLHCRAL